VDQHRSSDSHDGLNVALGYSIVMMGPDASEEGFLIELEDGFGEGLGCEVRTVVQQVLRRNHSGVSVHQLEGLLGMERFRGAECGLQFDVDVAGGGVHKDAAAFVHLVLLCFAAAAEQSASSGADEVIDRDTLSGEQLILS
jgi:hypothetical protein